MMREKKHLDFRQTGEEMEKKNLLLLKDAEIDEMMVTILTDLKIKFRENHVL